MKRTVILILILGEIIGIINQRLFAASEKFELKTSEATLTIDQNRNLKISQNNGKFIQVKTSINNLWKITLKNNLSNREYEFTPDKNFKIIKNDKILRLIVNSFSVNGKTLPIEAEFTMSIKDDAFCFSGLLTSDSGEWTFKELDYPCITGIQIRNENVGIYWPRGFGQYFDDPVNFGSKSLWYPSSEGQMPWFSVCSLNAGLYIGNHDPSQGAKSLNLTYLTSLKVFKASITTPIYKNEYQIPDIMIKSYYGEWYKASKFYRNWYDRHFKLTAAPEWAINGADMLLAIMKQQNLEVMWTYKDIDKLCDIADQFNLGTIGLWGWAIGGHDRYYPNYQPDNLLGGREELEKAIERAHKRGIKIIIYANGKIMDTSTDYYLYNAMETILITDWRAPMPDMRFYMKQKNSTPVIFAQACAGSELWRKTMCDLGLQAVSLRADGIIYDQVPVFVPISCFSKNHDHQPGESDAKYRLQMMSEIREKVKITNPDFVVITEGTDDALMKGLDYSWGYGIGVAPAPNVFPELFKYTFPEYVVNQRNALPMITRTDANFAAIYGFRHEIECRYPGDVEYLINGTLPIAESYSNVTAPPNIIKMNLVSAIEATKYVKTLIDFEKKNSVFFRQGKFIDREGIEVTGNDIVAKGFINGNRIGVVVWNQSESGKGEFSVTVPEYKAISAMEPGNDMIEVSSPLEPNSIRLIVFEKTK